VSVAVSSSVGRDFPGKVGMDFPGKVGMDFPGKVGVEKRGLLLYCCKGWGEFGFLYISFFTL